MLPAMSINYLAVLACAIVAMPVGFLWFGPLFGKAWARHMGFGDMQAGLGIDGEGDGDFLRQQPADRVGARPQHRGVAGIVLGTVSRWGTVDLRGERGVLQLAGILPAHPDEPRGVGDEKLGTGAHQRELRLDTVAVCSGSSCRIGSRPT